MRPFVRAGIALIALVLLGKPVDALAWRTLISNPEPYDLNGLGAVEPLPNGEILVSGWYYYPSTRRDALALKLDASGQEMWRTTIDGGIGYIDFGMGAAADASGDVFLAAQFLHIPTGSLVGDLAVIKLDGSTGTEIWRLRIPSGLGNDVAIDSAGDVFATGTLIHPDDNRNLVALKIDGATGNEIWRTEIDGTEVESADSGHEILLSASGDVFVSGGIQNAGLTRRPTVARLDGTTGAVFWREDLTFARGIDPSLALDSAENVTIATQIADDLGVVKLDGSTGAELWRTSIDAVGLRDVGVSVAVDADDDVIASGYHNGQPGSIVVKLSGATGGELWRNVLSLPNSIGDETRAVLAHPSGAVFTTGWLERKGSSYRDMYVVRLDGSTGATGWQQTLNVGTKHDFEIGEFIATSASGGVVVGGMLDRQISIAEFDPASGTVGPIVGRTLLVKDHATSPDKRKLVAKLQESTITAPAPGSADDPITAGATLSLSNPTTSESVSFALPPGPDWQGFGSPPGISGYRYTDTAGANGPCKSVTVFPTKFIKIVCSGKKAPLDYSLDEATQGALTVSLQLGSAPPQCGVFGGQIKKDIGTANPGPAGKFKGNKAPADGACPTP